MVIVGFGGLVGFLGQAGVLAAGFRCGGGLI